MDFKGTPLPEDRQRYFRRKYARERLLAGVLLVPAAPMIGMLVLLIRSTSRGPGIFKQTRIGLHGRAFQVYKLRSMRTDAEADGRPRWSAKRDSRVTWLGRILRKLHLDELPQLWNVVRGDMALVGPRPERPEFIVVLERAIPGYHDRLAVLPGITGLAQINLPPDVDLTSVRRKQDLDVRYIREAKFLLDMRMIMATALRIIGLKGDLVIALMRLKRTPCVPAGLDEDPLMPVMPTTVDAVAQEIPVLVSDTAATETYARLADDSASASHDSTRRGRVARSLQSASAGNGSGNGQPHPSKPR